MEKFSIEKIYGCTRRDYCTMTGITPEEMSRHLEAEAVMLTSNLFKIKAEYESGGAFTDEVQRERAKLLTVIQNKITAKKLKIGDIKREFNLPLDT
jgi:hypothetical protein